MKKIMFISYTYDVGWTYQENLLPKACMDNGHMVLCVASNVGADKYGKLGNQIHVNDPVYVKRLDTIFKWNLQLSARIRYLKGLYPLIENFKPDVIFLHSMQSLNLVDLSRYKIRYPNVKIYFNSHTDYYTSGTNWLSMNILHKVIYKSLLHKYIGIAEKFFFISRNCGEFLWDVYQIPKEKTELLSLGGTVQKKEDIDGFRNEVIEELMLQEDPIIFIQVGKFDKKKRLVEAMRAFTQIRNNKTYFIIIGSVAEDIKNDFNSLISQDSRIRFLGWKADSDIIKFLCAADVYVQPGKVSALMQTALCCSCAIISNDLDDYRPFINNENGWLVNSEAQLLEAMKKVDDNPSVINAMKQSSCRIALEKLEQRILVEKFTG